MGLFLCFFSVTTHAADHLNPQWLKIMRYNKTFFSYQSEIDSQKYFFSKDGMNDPKAEYVASIQNLNLPKENFKDINKHPACLFPGRYIYLKRNSKEINSFDLKQCNKFQRFKNKIKLESVSIIFSSYYINRPASAFGHTFLKLNSGDAKTNDLKAYGVDFSANVTTNNPVLYGIYGIIGGFYGSFNLMPYFLKLREYNDYESRDLYEFLLNFNESEKELLVGHLWDMNQAQFDYFYFTENCSYHILRFVDAIAPSHDLLKDISKPVMPIDTLYPLIENKSFTKAIYFRPSLSSRLLSQVNKMSKDEKKSFKKIINSLDLSPLESVKKVSKTRLLDTLIDYTDYKYSKKIFLGDKTDKVNDFKREILLQRSKLGGFSKAQGKKEIARINLSHKPRKVQVGPAFDKNHGFILSHRFALHNILEPQGDLYSNFTLEMGKLDLFINKKNGDIRVKDLNIAKVLALRPFSLIDQKISWDFSFGIKEKNNLSKKLGAYIDVGVGPSFTVEKGFLLLFLRTSFSNILARKETQSNLLGISPEWIFNYKSLGFKINYTRWYGLDKHQQDSKYTFTQEMQYTFSKSVATSLRHHKDEITRKYSMSLDFYY